MVLLLGVVPAMAFGVPLEAMISPGTTRRSIFVLLMGIAFVYHFLLELYTGQTVGKWLFSLRVLHDTGEPLGVRGSFVRNALRLIDGLGYWGVAVAVILVRGDGKRLGDLFGHTLVVKTE